MKANCLLSKMSIFNLRGRGQEKENLARGKGGNYSREAIILTILLEGQRLFKGGN